MTDHMSTSRVRSSLSDAIDQVRFGGDRILLKRNGKDVAALVSVADLRLLRKLEDELDLASARRVLASPDDSEAWEAVKSRLGLGGRKAGKRAGRAKPAKRRR